MSYGRTNNRHIAEPQKIGDANFLSFAQGSLVQVFAKDIGKDGQYWEAEVWTLCCDAVLGGVGVQGGCVNECGADYIRWRYLCRLGDVCSLALSGHARLLSHLSNIASLAVDNRSARTN